MTETYRVNGAGSKITLITPTVGISVGSAVGVSVGSAVGVSVGSAVGVSVGSAVGVSVGSAVGVSVGSAVGVSVGSAIGVSEAGGVGVSPVTGAQDVRMANANTAPVVNIATKARFDGTLCVVIFSLLFRSSLDRFLEDYMQPRRKMFTAKYCHQLQNGLGRL
jgi:hypothetical protein